MSIAAEGPSPGETSATARSAQAPGAPATILVIDDSPTILRVVELVLKKAGYNVVTASDGQQGLETAKSRPPDLVLLDFIMPRLNGYQVCKAMAADPALKGIPVVLMSAKGDKVGDKFIQVLGIADYITKPFSPEAVLAVATHTLEKFGKGASSPTTPGAQPHDDSAAARALRGAGPQEPPSREESDRAHAGVEVQARFAARLASDVASQFHPDGGADRDRFAERLATALKQALGRLGSEVSAVGIGGALLGDLTVLPIADIMQLLQMEAQTGIFTVRHTDAEARVYFRRGRVDLVTARGLDEEFRLGRYFVERGFLSASELEQLLRGRRDGKRRLGGQLVQLGYLSADDLKGAILRQSSEILYEILRWTSGTFAFTPLIALPEDAVEANLDVSVEGLLMEGYRRIDEWHFIETQIDDFELSFARAEEVIARVGLDDLTKEERAVLDAIDGKRTIRDLTRHTKMGSFNLCKVLFRLFSIRVIRKVREGAP